MVEQTFSSAKQPTAQQARTKASHRPCIPIKAARRQFIEGIDQIYQRLSQRLAKHPVALTAAKSELVTCVQFRCYFAGVIGEQQPSDPSQVCDAVYEWAVKRARIWIFD